MLASDTSLNVTRHNYESAILSDIGGTDESKAPYLDRVTGGDYARYGIATGLATSVFMYSHSGAVQRIATAERCGPGGRIAAARAVPSRTASFNRLLEGS